MLRAAAPALPKDAITQLKAGGELQPEKLRGTKLTTRRSLFVLAVPAATGDVGRPLGKSQQGLLALLTERGELSIDELRRHVKNPRAVVRALEARGLLRSEEREVSADPFFSSAVEREEGPTPNSEQAVAIRTLTDALESGGGYLPVSYTHLTLPTTPYV